MILSDARILEEIEKGTIKITPFNAACLGSNSYENLPNLGVSLFARQAFAKHAGQTQALFFSFRVLNPSPYLEHESDDTSLASE